MVNKKSLSERDICTKYINPALAKAGWNIKTQIREEVFFTDGRIIVQGKMHTRDKENCSITYFSTSSLSNKKPSSKPLTA
jgi:type I site-specific restriction endonuclease